MTAAPPVIPSAPPDPSLNDSVPPTGSHLCMNLPRFPPIAMNSSPHPRPHPPSDSIVHDPYRHYAPPPTPSSLQEQHQHQHQKQSHPAPTPPLDFSPCQLEHIESRLRQLEQEDAARMLTRTHQLAVRKREDEEFRRMTEHAELEEEDLRKQRKRLKRESMGLTTYDATLIDSPPLLSAQPRRLSETNAATTLAFFKQQASPEPRQQQLQLQLQQQQQQQQQQQHQTVPPSQAPQPQQQQQPTTHDLNAPAGPLRRKQKYTIKNVEAWGERHGRPAAHDSTGRALWKRPSDGSLVYLTCPVYGCGKNDFVTLHGFMCHLTKKHKDRSLGSQSRALEVCGIVYDRNAPLLPGPASTSSSSIHQDSMEDSRFDSAQAEPDGYQELDYSSSAVEDEDDQTTTTAAAAVLYHHGTGGVKVEQPTEKKPKSPSSSSYTRLAAAEDLTALSRTNGNGYGYVDVNGNGNSHHNGSTTTKPSISSIIDHHPESDTYPREATTTDPAGVDVPVDVDMKHESKES